MSAASCEFARSEFVCWLIECRRGDPMRLITIVLLLLVPFVTHAAERTICVKVTVRHPGDEVPGKASPTPGPALITTFAPDLPVGQDPVSYLKRLLEYFVSHERGFVAVQSGCQDEIVVEMYPLREGWTVFARYTGTGREERVDALGLDELSQFGERVVLALLYDQPISTTIKRDTVLRADSQKATQQVRGTSHLIMGLGTQVRVGDFPTSQPDGSAATETRLFSPITLGLGYRGKFENWGVEMTGALGVGTAKTGLAQNTGGGHVDYGGNVALGLHFLRYTNPRGLSSFYFGSGGSFEIIWFSQIKPQAERTNGDRTYPVSGGFDIDFLLGVEFMRASKVQFFLQCSLDVPAYAVQNGDVQPSINTWFPAAALTLGMLF
jgi:hypothetical protein